jgi:hypothetical protein
MMYLNVQTDTEKNICYEKHDERTTSFLADGCLLEPYFINFSPEEDSLARVDFDENGING